MVQWKMAAVLERKLHYWRYTHFWLNRDYGRKCKSLRFIGDEKQPSFIWMVIISNKPIDTPYFSGFHWSMIGREERYLDHPLAGIVFLASSIYFYKHWIERMCRPFLAVESLFLLDPPSKKVGFCAGIFFIITYYSGRNRTYFVDFFLWGEGSAIFSLFFSSEVWWEIDDIYLDFLWIFWTYSWLCGGTGTL